MPDQAAASLTFNRPKLSTTAPATVLAEYRLASPAENQAKIEQYISLDPAAVSQQSTVTIAAGTVGDIYAITVGGDAPPTAGSSSSTLASQTYLYKQKTGDTPTIIAKALAALIDSDPRVTASSSTGTITVTGAVSGLAFTLDNTGSTTVGNVTIPPVTRAASGSVKHVKVVDIALVFDVSSDGLPTCNISVQWFTGDATSVAFQAPVLYSAKGPRSIDTMQVANGIPRPA